MANITTQSPLAAPTAIRATAFGASLKDRLTRYLAYRRTLNELRDLSTAELADIGLNPSMLRSVAYEATYGA